MELYDILFSASIRHSYYRDGICKDIVVKPDSYTAMLIKKYGFVFRETPDGFLILTEINKLNNEAYLSDKVEMNLQFNFLLVLKNPYLPNITEFQEPDKEYFHFYSNKLIDTIGENERTYLFRQGNLIQSATYTFTIDKNPNDDGHVERNGTAVSIQTEADHDSLTYAASGLDPGVYRYHSGDFYQNFYLAAPSFASKPYALVSIELNDQSILNEVRLLKKPVYRLQFEPKATYWQYIVNINNKYENLVVESAGNSEGFEKTESIVSGNKPVIIFTSKDLIPITETRDDYYKLKSRNGDPANDVIIISKLPVPEMEVMSRNTDGKTYSPIFVNF